MIKVVTFLFLFAFSLNGERDNYPEAQVKLRIEGIKSIQGNLGILVFNSASGFPNDAEKAVLNLKVEVNAKTMEIELEKLPYGTYAIAILHDKNKNKIMDKGVLGIPKEPFGFSNISEVPFGAPSFQEAKINLDAQQPVAVIQLLEI